MNLPSRPTFQRGVHNRAQVSRGIIEAQPDSAPSYVTAPGIDPELAARLKACVTARQRARVWGEYRAGRI